ncbi:hypothetical protein JHK86_006534 [Glycine max]|nr:hypothetical protein JHK86_006534 [Glycine max]
MEEEGTSTKSNPSLRERINLNVGGKLFETMLSMLHSNDPNSLLFSLSNRRLADPSPIFIDRDLEILSILLSLLRTSHLPSAVHHFSKHELGDEALFYGIDAHLCVAAATPPFSDIDVALFASLRPPPSASPPLLSLPPPALSRSPTVAKSPVATLSSPTPPPPAHTLTKSTPSTNLRKLGCYNRHIGSVHWTDLLNPRIFKSSINAITSSTNYVFALFDCPYGENFIIEVDKEKLQTGKLMWILAIRVLVKSAVTDSAFGYFSYVRL